MIEAILRNISKRSLQGQMTWVQILAWPLLSCVQGKKKKIASPSLSLFMEVRITRRVHVSQRSCANKLLNIKDLEYRESSVNRGFYHVTVFSVSSPFTFMNISFRG